MAVQEPTQNANGCWCDSQSLALALGVSERMAQKVLNRAARGLPYRGVTLRVVSTRGRGGKRGESYLVAREDVERLTGGPSTLPVPVPVVPSAPALPCADPESIAKAAVAAIQAHKEGDWAWRFDIIRPAVAHPKGTAGRRAVVDDLAGRAHRLPSGDERRFGSTTLYQWIKEYERRGFEGLGRKGRADRGQRRVAVSLEWDRAARAAGMADADLERIAAAVLKRVRSLWATGVPGWRKVQALALAELVSLSRQAGLDGPDAEMVRLCTLPRRIIEAEKRYRVLSIKDKDAKQFADLYTPRVRRNYDGIKPMDIVVADVHHMDNIMRRDNGRTFTPKMISWFDVATNRAFSTIIFVGEGECVRQEHVAASFIAMTQDSAWGVPRTLYLDNGGEFRKLGLVDDMMQLARLAESQGFAMADLAAAPDVHGMYRDAWGAIGRTVRKSLPYNAQGKPGVEGFFSVWERTLAPMIGGHVGGNRMKKKTQNVGKEPLAFDGTEEDFQGSVNRLFDLYETLPQSGKLKGRSPRQALTDFVEAGWKRLDVDPLALALVFATETTREVTRGEFQWNNTLWRAEELLGLPAGTTIRVRVPLVGAKTMLGCLSEDGAFLGFATASVTFGPLDRAGAKDRGHRAKVQSRHLKAMRRDTESVDVMAAIDGYVALQPVAPDVPNEGTIRLTGALESAAMALRQMPPSSEEEDTAPAIPARDPSEIRRRLLGNAA